MKLHGYGKEQSEYALQQEKKKKKEKTVQVSCESQLYVKSLV